MSKYFLIKDGDVLEQKYWNKFVEKDFPSYEKYWQIYIVPLTNRPYNKRFKTDEELKKIIKNDHDIYLAQLHYTILKHLGRVYDLINSTEQLNYDNLVEGLTRICGALDVADEFLERNCNPEQYRAWDIPKSIKARLERRKKENPNKNISDYRNYFIHCPLLPSFNGLYYPKIGYESKYYKWISLIELKIKKKY